MILFCEKCNENHEFTLRDAEFLIYGLHAAFTDECNRGTSHSNKEQYGWKPFELECLQTMLGVACDVENYGEHVHQQRDCRMAHELGDMSWHMDEIVHHATKIREAL